MKITRYENAIFGLRPIIEAITAGQEIDTLFIQKGLKGDIFPELWELVKKHRVNYKHVPVEKLNRLTRKNHQGVFAFVSPISFHRTENVIPQLFEEGKVPLFLILDRVTDVEILEQLLEVLNALVFTPSLFLKGAAQLSMVML